MPELVCMSLYGVRTQQGRVQMSCGERDFTIQMSIAEARDLAQNLIGAASAAETDHAFATWMRESMECTEGQIAAALQEMRKLRQAAG